MRKSHLLRIARRNDAARRVDRIFGVYYVSRAGLYFYGKGMPELISQEVAL